MSASYNALLAEHAILPSFVPLVAKASLPTYAFLSLTGAFVGAFYFSTLKAKGQVKEEIISATIASVLGGFGIVFGFCAVGANV